MTTTTKVKVQHVLKVTHPKGSTEATCSCGHWAISVPHSVPVLRATNTITANHALHKGLAGAR